MASAADDDGACEPRPWRRAVALVTVISLLNSIASMIIVPVLPRLVQQFTGAAPIPGTLSDAFGRPKVILISAFGLAAD